MGMGIAYVLLRISPEWPGLVLGVLDSGLFLRTKTLSTKGPCSDISTFS